jgi:hypothetical protein
VIWHLWKRQLRNPVQFQDREFLPEKEVEEQRHARGFQIFIRPSGRSGPGTIEAQRCEH